MELYRIKGTDDFGSVLATDSTGMKIFELKGGGIKVVAADQIEEVFPFTFAVSFDGDKEYHFQGDAEQFKVDDILVYTNESFRIGLCRVTKVDTKSRAATKRFEGYKLDATRIQ